GMPGSGKSTLGELLAKRLGWHLVDTDLLMEANHDRPLQNIFDGLGYEGFCIEEERTLLRLEGEQQIISTGGSAVYSESAMSHLGSLGLRIFLNLPLEDVLSRVTNFEKRGIVCRPGQDLAELFKERHPLYLRYADQVIGTGGMSVDEQVHKLQELLNKVNYFP
ncbi:MAG: shikimate kinase, partial [SAR324 cluster bacterium]|nr:shikimate kinase [SAR324 cluster bacterium]